MGKLVDLTGRIFYKLKVLNRDYSISKPHWRCICECGNSVTILSNSLISGNSKSCGCLKIEKAKSTHTTHGHNVNFKTSNTYNAWAGLKARCLNEGASGFENYGGRGVVVCEEWISSFENFLKDMGEKPVNTSIDRINNNLGYYKENCRWATRKQQQNNTRSTKILTYKGVSKPLTAWAEELGIRSKTLYCRIFEYNWPLEKALTTLTSRKK